MAPQTKQIVIKKQPSLMVKKKEAGSNSPAFAHGRHAGSAPPGTSPTHCDQCGSKRIPAGPPQFADFRCPYCGQINQSRGYVPGTDLQCVACSNPIMVPPPPIRPVPAHLGGVSMTPQRLKFFCVFCGQKLSATLEMVGQPTVCPSCNRGLTIPPPPGHGI